MKRRTLNSLVGVIALGSLFLTSACAWVEVPDARNVNIPSPSMAEKRKTAINERPDSVMYLPLGEDVLVPEVLSNNSFPQEEVGPYELRGETLAGALQLILADYDIALAFETDQGLTRRITVANLHGNLGQVVDQVCALANLYCSFENGSVTVKDTQTFTVTLPPIGTEDETTFLTNVAAGLTAIVGSGVPAPIVDSTTRTIVYSATQRTADVATRYFQRLRANTAMIVFETYIWEVSLNSGNSTGIDWDKMQDFGKFGSSIALNGSVGTEFLDPVSIGLPTTQDITGTPTDLIEFLSQFGAVKTISQPQITVLSGSEAELRVADTRNYVSQIATTLDEGQSTTSVNTDSVDTGFTLTIGSSWDKSTVYANVAIELTDVKQIDDFSFSDGGEDGATTRIQLPQTSERQLKTQIRVRPGDSVLIAGLVRENDNFDSKGIGFMAPVIPDSRTAQSANLELVILLRPRVVIYTATDDKRYVDYAMKKQHKLPASGAAVVSPKESEGQNLYSQPQPVPEPLGALSPEESTPAIITPSVPPVSRTPVSSSVPLSAAAPVPEPLPIVTPEPVWPAPAATPAATDTVPASEKKMGSGYVSRSEPVVTPVLPAPSLAGDSIPPAPSQAGLVIPPATSVMPVPARVSPYADDLPAGSPYREMPAP